MTKRSSLVMPPVLTSVAAIVDILDRSPKSLLQCSPPCAGPGQIGPRGYVDGNIAVKPRPIRLLARRARRCMHASRSGYPVTCAHLPYCGAQTERELTLFCMEILRACVRLFPRGQFL